MIELGFIDLIGFRAFGAEFLVIGAPCRDPLAADLRAFMVAWKASFHDRFGAEVPGVAPWIVVRRSAGANLRALRQQLGREIIRLKELAVVPDIGVLVTTDT